MPDSLVFVVSNSLQLANTVTQEESSICYHTLLYLSLIMTAQTL